MVSTQHPLVTLGALSVADTGKLAVLANNRKIWLMVRDRFPQPYWYIDAERFIAQVMMEKVQMTWAVRWEGELAGIVSLIPYADINKKTMEVGYWVGEPYWGRGIATAAVKAVSDLAFTAFDIARLEAHVFPSNIASQRVLEKAGFHHEATLKQAVFKAGEMMDDLIYARLRG